MTAPDPGLTDLIAAHRLKQSYWNWWGCTGCDWRTKGTYSSEPTTETATEHAKHVVEQHTNGRMAELEAAVRKRIQLLREHDGFGAAHADGYMGMNWTAYYEGAYQAQVMAATDLENDLRAALEGEQQ